MEKSSRRLLDLLVKGGRVVTEHDTFQADVGVKDGKVVSISRSTIAEVDKVVDASEKLVLPGAIDPHTHINNAYPFYGVKREEDYESASIAAAWRSHDIHRFRFAGNNF